MEAAKTLPACPAIRGACNLLPLDAGGALVVTASTTLMIRGAAFGDLFPFLLPRLDGTLTVEEIVSQLDIFREEDVRAALHLLWSNGLLEDPASPSPSARVRQAYGDHFAFLSGYGFERSVEAYRNLRNAHIGLLGNGSLVDDLARQIAQCGVRGIRLPSGSPEQESRADSRQGLIDELHRINPDGAHELRPIAADADNPSLRDFLEGLSLTAIVANEWPTAFLEALNGVALSLAQPWLLCLVEGKGASIGPLFVPGETACYTCYSRRRRGVVDFAAGHDAIQRAAGRDFYERLGVAPGLPAFAAGLAVIEIVKFCTFFEVPASLGAELRFELASTRLERHPVLKLPRCPDCGPARLHLPQAAIWPSFLDDEG